MKRHLPDVNVLLALIWPRHKSHVAAAKWFMDSGRQAWATNVLTQLGVLRLLTNPAVSQSAVSAATAVQFLVEATNDPGHQFWPIGHEVSSELVMIAPNIRGHQQWTDAVLLWHAAQQDGTLTTFDLGVREMATGKLRNHLLVLKDH